MCHDMRAVARADLHLVGLDDRIERGRVNEPLGDEDGLERADAELHVGEVGALVVIVPGMERARLPGEVGEGLSMIFVHAAMLTGRGQRVTIPTRL
jgi:hypothetical protein